MEAKFDKERVGLKEIKPVTFGEYASQYLNYSKANKVYSLSWRRNIVSLKTLTRFFEDMLLNSMESWEVGFYKTQRLEKGIKLTTSDVLILLNFSPSLKLGC